MSALNQIVCFDPANRALPCPICGGIGYIKYDVPIEDRRWGKLHRCPNFPTSEDKDRLERLRKISNLGAFAGKTFDNFETARPGYKADEIASLGVALKQAISYAQNPDGWFLLEGSYGCGKTHLAAAIGNERLRMGDMVLFITTPDLLDHLRSAYSPSSEMGYDEFFERVRNATMLILDDLGVENPSPWAQEKLFQLLNHRYVNEKATVITTNAELERLDARVRSRLGDIQVTHHVTIKAPDYRTLTVKRDEQLLSRLGHYQNMTFDNFDANNHLTAEERQNLMAATRIAGEYARDPQGWLLLVGNYGTGKTHLAAAIANYRQQAKQDSVMFITVADLLDYLKTTFSPDSTRTFDDLFNAIRNVKLLVLDDYGSEASKPWAQEKLFQLLDYRYVAQMPTIITTAQELDKLNQRLLSRLLDSRVCRNVALTLAPYALRMKRGR